MRRGTIVLATLAVLCAAVLWIGQAQITRPQPTPGPNDLQSVTLIFGSKDPQPAKWDGSASITSGSIVRITGWHFTPESKVSGTSWECATHPWGLFSAG